MQETKKKRKMSKAAIVWLVLALTMTLSLMFFAACTNGGGDGGGSALTKSNVVGNWGNTSYLGFRQYQLVFNEDDTFARFFHPNSHLISPPPRRELISGTWELSGSTIALTVTSTDPEQAVVITINNYSLSGGRILSMNLSMPEYTSNQNNLLQLFGSVFHRGL